MAAAETYVIRIYRRSTTAPEELAGVVESVTDGRTYSFGSFYELLAVLGQRIPSGKPGSGRPRPGAKKPSAKF